MAGDHAAWLKQMAKILGTTNSGGGTATLIKDPQAERAAPGGNGSNGKGPVALKDDPDKDEDETPVGSGSGAPTGSGGGGSVGGGSGAPVGGGSGAPKAGAGGPTGGGAGGKTTTDSASGGTTAGPVGGSGPPAGGSSGSPSTTGTPTSGTVAAPPAGSPDATSGAKPSTIFDTAEQAALIAQQMLTEINQSVEKVDYPVTETKVFAEGAPSIKKEIDKAGADADAAEKGMPPAPKLAAPQGKDPQAQYESAIQITGDTRKVQQDAHAKADVVREQKGAVDESNKLLESTAKKATANAAKIQDALNNALSLSMTVDDAAKGAKLRADESRKKGDQAAKDKSADAAELGKKAKEDAQFSAQANDAAAKAKAAVERLRKMSSDADSQVAGLKKLAEDSKTAVDARAKQVSGLEPKLKPYSDAVDAAEKQEAECQSKVSEKDADAILKKKYDQLGGDDELSKALAAEDKAFETVSERYRARAKDWYKDTTRKLDAYKPMVEDSVKRCEKMVPQAEEWLKREEPLAERAKKAAEALGTKLDTPPGKELMYEISQQTELIAKIKSGHDEDKAELEKANAAKSALDKRYDAVNAQNSANDKYLEERRTEVNNLLQMENMTLEQKVDYLQRKPKLVRDRIQKQMEGEIDRIVRMSVAETQDEDATFRPAPDTSMPAAIDWKAINDKIAKYQTMSLDDLKKDDPALFDINQDYLKAGGDQALLDKRLDEWKAKESQDEINQRRAGDEYLKRSEQMRGDYDKANKEAIEARRIEKQHEEFRAAIEARFAELQKKTKPNVIPPLDGLEKAEYKLLEKQIQRLKTNEGNLVGMTVMDDFGKNTASTLIEKDRQLYEQMQNRHRKPLPKPSSEDIQKMPLRAKYAALTGKTAP